MPRRAPPVLASLAAALSACAPDAEPPQVVLLVSLDSTRQDLLGAYGRRPRHAPELSPSPNLDRLAAEGALFENAYATTSWTLPSHVSMLSGRPELVHAVDLPHHQPDPTLRTLPERLRVEGFRTAGFYSGPFLEPHFGFARGFDRYEACYGEELAEAMRRANELRADGESAGPELAEAMQRIDRLSVTDVSSERVTDGVLEELERAAVSGRPAFVFAHYFDPHHDYAPPAPYRERFDPEYAGTIRAERLATNERISRPDPTDPDRRVRVVSDRDLEHLLALYEGEMAWTDHQVGRLLDALDELGLAERALVVVTADHGDEFFEHRSIGHRKSLFEEVLRVPLLVRHPPALPAGVRVDAVASTLDVPATVYDLLGLPPDPALESRSLAPLVRGEEEGGGRAALGRLVRTTDGVMPLAGIGEPVPVQRVAVTESLRLGAIKVLRQREWVRPRSALPPEAEAALRRRGAELRRREHLAWIDLERHPDEPEEAYRTDFDDARARRALERFHDDYRRLLRERREVRTVAGDSALLGHLEGLGYVEQDAPDTAPAADLTLPPPGRELVPGARRHD